jgi:hypothetical protein
MPPLNLALLLLALAISNAFTRWTGAHPCSYGTHLGSIKTSDFVYDEALRLSDKLSPSVLKEVALNLNTEWNRYIFLREFLEYVPDLTVPEGELRLQFVGNATFDQMEHVVALQLGYRLDENDGSSIQLREDLVPMSWATELTVNGILEVPCVTNFHHDHLDYLISRDLPSGVENEEASELVLAILGGVESAKLLKEAAQKGAVDIRRKLLLVQWLYCYGFLNENFPASGRFVPYHQRGDNDDDDDDDDDDE